MTKDPSILRFLERLQCLDVGWQIVDHWDADLCAIGIARRSDVRRLVYVSTFQKAPGTYDYECETPSGPEATDYIVTKSGNDVPESELIEVILGRLRDDRG